MTSEHQDQQAESIEIDAQIRYPLSIVGIGASAGGLRAFSDLLQHLSIHPAKGNANETGMAYVLIQHLAPHHPSLLTEILARTTVMPVLEEIGRAHV